jgi:hypothetical protein
LFVELETTRAEELDPVVGSRVVAGGDDHAERGQLRDAGKAFRSRSRDRRRRDDAEGDDISPGIGQAIDDGLLQPGTGRPRVASDDDQRSGSGRRELIDGSGGERARELGGQLDAGNPPNPVSPEQRHPTNPSLANPRFSEC